MVGATINTTLSICDIELKRNGRRVEKIVLKGQVVFQSRENPINQLVRAQLPNTALVPIIVPIADWQGPFLGNSGSPFSHSDESGGILATGGRGLAAFDGAVLNGVFAERPHW